MVKKLTSTKYMEYYDKRRNRWVKVVVDETDDKIRTMHDYVVAQIDIMTTMEEIKRGERPERN